MRLVATAVLLCVLTTACPGADTPGESRDRATELLRDLPSFEMKPTGEFNLLACAGVLLAVIALTALLWNLQLVVAKILVVAIPVLAAVAAGLLVPRAGEPRVWVGPLLVLVFFGVAFSLACMLYATLWDLKRKVAALERVAGSPR